MKHALGKYFVLLSFGINIFAKPKIDGSTLYHKYLEIVAEESEDFGSMNEIISRYATLADANNDLLKMTEEHSREVDELRNELSNLIKVRTAPAC